MSHLAPSSNTSLSPLVLNELSYAQAELNKLSVPKDNKRQKNLLLHTAQDKIHELLQKGSTQTLWSDLETLKQQITRQNSEGQLREKVGSIIYNLMDNLAFANLYQANNSCWTYENDVLYQSQEKRPIEERITSCRQALSKVSSTTSLKVKSFQDSRPQSYRSLSTLYRHAIKNQLEKSQVTSLLRRENRGEKIRKWITTPLSSLDRAHRRDLALITAVEKGDFKVCFALLSPYDQQTGPLKGIAKGCPNLKNEEGKTLLTLAEENKHQDIATLLKSLGATSNFSTSSTLLKEQEQFKEELPPPPKKEKRADSPKEPAPQERSKQEKPKKPFPYRLKKEYCLLEINRPNYQLACQYLDRVYKAPKDNRDAIIEDIMDELCEEEQFPLAAYFMSLWINNAKTTEEKNSRVTTLVIYATKIGEKELALKLINQITNLRGIWQRDFEERVFASPLTVAIYYSQEEIVKALINKDRELSKTKRYIDPYLEEQNDYLCKITGTPLLFLVREPEIAQILIDNGADTTIKGLTLQAARKGRTELLKYYLERDPSRLQEKDEEGNTLLHQALLSGNVETLNYLTGLRKLKAEPNSDGLMPGAYAAKRGQAKVLKLCIESGLIDLNNEKERQHVIKDACDSKDLKTCLILHNKLEEMGLKEERGLLLQTIKQQQGGLLSVQSDSALHTAIKANSYEAVWKCIKKNPALINEHNAEGLTPLQSACLQIGIDDSIIEALLNGGADPSALSLSAYHNHANSFLLAQDIYLDGEILYSREAIRKLLKFRQKLWLEPAAYTMPVEYNEIPRPEQPFNKLITPHLNHPQFGKGLKSLLDRIELGRTDRGFVPQGEKLKTFLKKMEHKSAHLLLHCQEHPEHEDIILGGLAATDGRCSAMVEDINALYASYVLGEQRADSDLAQSLEKLCFSLRNDLFTELCVRFAQMSDPPLSDVHSIAYLKEKLAKRLGLTAADSRPSERREDIDCLLESFALQFEQEYQKALTALILDKAEDPLFKVGQGEPFGVVLVKAIQDLPNHEARPSGMGIGLERLLLALNKMSPEEKLKFYAPKSAKEAENELKTSNADLFNDPYWKALIVPYMNNPYWLLMSWDIQNELKATFAGLIHDRKLHKEQIQTIKEFQVSSLQDIDLANDLETHEKRLKAIDKRLLDLFGGDDSFSADDLESEIELFLEGKFDPRQDCYWMSLIEKLAIKQLKNIPEAIEALLIHLGLAKPPPSLLP